MHFDKICRICTMEAADPMPSIFNELVGDKLCAAELLNVFTDISACRNDGLPEKICTDCLFELYQVAAFKRKTERSDRELKKHRLEESLLPQEQHQTLVSEIKIEQDYGFMIEMGLKPAECDEKQGCLLPSQSDCVGYSVESSSCASTLKAENKFVPAKKANNKKKSKKLPPKELGRVSETSRPYQCSACKSRYAKYETLSRHIKNCLPRSVNPSEAMVNCFDCETTFWQISSLARHISNLTCQRHQQRRQISATQSYHCAHCEKVYLRRNMFQKHLLVHGFSPKFQCPFCDSEFEEDAMEEHVRLQHSEHSHACSVCGKVFAQPFNMRRHMLLHSRGKRSDIRKHACHLCPMRFTDSYALKNHLCTHTGEKPYACDQCDRTFTTRKECLWHKRSHIEGYMHQCTLCTLSFARYNDLQKHRKTNHVVQKRVQQPKTAVDIEVPVTANTGEQSFECDICGHRLPTSSARARHKKRNHNIEKQYGCNLCPMRFAYTYALKSHRRTHTGERPYACDQCDRTFTTRAECTWHKRTHVAGFMHPCTLCTLSFASYRALQSHRKTAHAGKRRVHQPKQVVAIETTVTAQPL